MSASSHAQPINVLLIEDNPTDIRLVQEVLRGSPSDRFNIVSASTLAQGLEHLSSDTIDVILLDLGLPDSQGFETFQAVEERAGDLPIIILTVSTNEELGLKAIRAGAQRFFSKDVLTPDGAYAEMFPQVIHYAIEHKRVEAALKQLSDANVRQVHMFDAMLSSLPDPVYLLDPDERYVYVCPQCEQMLGVPRAALIGKTWQEAGLSSSLMRTLHRGFSDVLTTGMSATADIEIETPTGLKKYEYTLSPVFDDNKKVEAVVLSTHDITERTRAEEALLRERNRVQQYLDLIDLAHDAIIIRDLDHRALFWNNGAEQLFGWTAEEAVGKRVPDLIRAEYPLPFKKFHAQLLKEGHWEGTVHCQTRDGTPLVIEHRFTVEYDAAGAPARLLSISYDTTAQRHAEEALRQTHEEMQTLNQELQSANEELRVVNEELEYRVDERTSELQAMTEELSSTNEELRVTNEELREEVNHRVRMERVAQQNAERTALLNRIITLADKHTKVPTYVSAMLDMFVDELDFDTASLRFRRGDVVELYDSRGLTEDFIAQIRQEPINTRPFDRIYEGEPYFDEGYVNSDPIRAHEANVVSALGIPLIAHGEVIGNFGLGGRRARTLTNAELQTLTAIGHEAGTVIARLKAEEQLRATATYTRNLIEASLDPFVTISAEGAITDVNTATEEVTGYSRDELIGSNFSNYFTEPDKAQAGYRQVFTDGFVKDYPLIIQHRTGRTIHVLYNATVYQNDAGEVQGVFAVARDITDRKRAEDELQRYSGHLEAIVEERTAQLKDSERLAGIGQTAAMIGHDLRNPLQALQFSLELERKYLEAMDATVQADPRVAKAAQLFSNMEQQIQYMDKIVSDLQDYARPLTLEREETDIARLIDETLSVLTIPESISVHSDVISPITASVDPHLMQRVLANLILNAVQAMPEGGDLAIGSVRRESAVVITVRDTGEGVPRHLKDTLFSPLTTGKAKGTGLGLAVVKRIVEAHDGAITFESDGGKGTKFIVTVPVHNEA